MKKVVRLLTTILAVILVTAVLNFLTEGIPLFGVPNIEKIERVEVKHGDYPDKIKEYTDEKNIELAVALTGYLRYSPLKGLSDDQQLIQITYTMDDGAERVVHANEKTVWWNGKPRALHDEETFVKMCTAIFFSQD